MRVAKSGTPTYRSWCAMRYRCLSPKSQDFRDYGGRGILVCKRWLHSFDNFLADMGERPPGKTLDRRNNNGNYTPRNCRWATNKEQARNARPCWQVTINGERKHLLEWCDLYGIHPWVVYARIHGLGWTPKKSIVTPKRKPSAPRPKQSGEFQWASALTNRKVRDIRASSERGSVLAKKYGVSDSTIHNVRMGKSWKHVK